MSERFQTDLPDLRVADYVGLFQPLPGWLAERLLKPDEKVAWVRGPWFNPFWERYLTHPALLLVSVALSVLGVGLVWLTRERQADPADLIITSVGSFLLIIVPTIIVLGLANGYFTRLVVTNFRLVILQGYETVRSWSIDDLPRSMLRYGRHGEKDQKPCIDLDAVKALLGGSSDQFTGSKAILSFGKQLERIQKGDRDRG